MAPGSKPSPCLLLGEKVARPKAVTDEEAMRRDIQHLCGRFVKRPYAKTVRLHNRQTNLFSPAVQRAAEGVGPYKQVWHTLKSHLPRRNIVTAGDEARSAAAAADTHAPLPTVHRTVGIPADAGTGLFEPRRPLFPKTKTPPKGVVIVTAGSSARSAAVAADTHTPLPTVHRTVGIAASRRPGFSSLVALYFQKQKTPRRVSFVFGAGDEARTRYLDLGKVALYQMSYAREWCLRPGSNWRHADFQSAALPTELPRHNGDQDGARTHDLQRDRLAF